jgi:very-short-patch-repair endonuclease
VKSIDWKPVDSMPLKIVEAKGDLWFSQKTLAALFGVTKQNVQIHIRDLREAGQPSFGLDCAIDQAEGSRTVKRLIKHYPFEVAHAIAVRSQRFEQLGWLLDLAKEREIAKSTYRIAPIKERAFGELLLGALAGLVTVIPQHHLPPHFIDFFIPEWRLAIEYDERHHRSARQMQADAERQAAIEQSLGARFVRVSVGREVEALNEILKIGIGNGEGTS